MLMKRLAFLLCMPLLPAVSFAGDPLVDNSKASADGPHVFYRGSNVVVKTIEQQDTAHVVPVKNHT